MDNSVNKRIRGVSAGAKRIRRTADDARRLILDAAEAAMGADGPAGLRLTEVAARAGVSHPTLLHHFGSRDALIAAVHRRGIAGMKDALAAAMRGAPAADTDIVGLVFAAYRSGIAQRVVWMFQSGFDMPASGAGGGMLADMVAELHALRCSLAPAGVEMRESDTAAIVHLTAIAALGDAVIGPRLRSAASTTEEAAGRARFERWFAGLIGRAVLARPSTDDQ